MASLWTFPCLAGALCAPSVVPSEPSPPPLPSSHREAPFVTEHPKVDATDFYLFNSYEPGRAGYVTLIADYQPFQSPYGGPNYFTMDPDARYQIHVDNDGDALEDITFEFTFGNFLRSLTLPIGPAGKEQDIEVPLVNLGPILPGDDSNLNVNEKYWVTATLNPRSGGVPEPLVDAKTGANTFSKPVDNIGNKTLPDYPGYAAQYVYDVVLPGNSLGRLFVGQRKDPFVVNLGEAFDLINIDPLGDPRGQTDDLADANVTSLILEIPTSFLVGAGNGTIGAWTTATLKRFDLLLKKPTFEHPEYGYGPPQQVSRLGMPLVNELVIGLRDKDRFNASHPSQDADFAKYVTNPTLPAIIEILFGGAGVKAPTLFPRQDLVQVFLTGLPGLNATATAAEYLRLNTNVPATPAAAQSNLGVLGGDLAGFPNGRRPGDDVVDAALRVVMGVLLSAQDAPSGQLPYTDGAYVDAGFFDTTFPYLKTPLPGSPR